MVEGLIAAGMDVARLNFSHGSYEEHARMVGLVRAAAERAGREVAILQDLSGPKIRIGDVAGGSDGSGRDIRVGDPLTLTASGPGNGTTTLSVSYPRLARELRPGDRILLADATLELTVEDVEGDEVTCRVMRGGRLRSHAGLNLPGVTLSVPALTPKDEDDLVFGLGQGVDAVALSFVQRAGDIVMLRNRITAAGASAVPIVAKLERPQALDDLEAILDAADAVMVARGDLGVELPPEEVPVLQKELIQESNARSKPVIVATQMLESMVRSPRPTRAEASDVANAVLDGADAVMLSAETAVGDYPFEAAAMAARIVATAEQTGARFSQPRRRRDDRRTTSAIPFAAKSIADDDVRVRAILCHTRTGETAKLLAAERPRTPVYAFGFDRAVLRRLCFVWGITPIPAEGEARALDRLEAMEAELVGRGIVSAGDMVTVVATIGSSLHANMLLLHEVQGAGGTGTSWEGE
jgi:pyruvate kinase